MLQDKIRDVGEYLRRTEHFGRSDVDWTSVAPYVISSLPFFYYRWHGDEQGMDIVIQPDRCNPQTAQLFSYPSGIIAKKVNLDHTQPIRTGLGILDWVRS